MEQTELNEKIEVLAKFEKGGLAPLAFKQGGRLIKVESIDLKYNYRSGGVDFYSYSISSGSNSYKITYNAKELGWRLEEVWIV
jgi:hypothetical protein